MKQRFEVDKFRAVFNIELLKVAECLLFDIFNNSCLIVPEVIKPLFELCAVTVAVDNHVEFDIPVATKAKTVDREIGASGNGFFNPVGLKDVVHFAVQEVGLDHRANFSFAAQPFGTLSCNVFLGKAAFCGNNKLVILNFKIAGVYFFRIE